MRATLLEKEDFNICLYFSVVFTIVFSLVSLVFHFFLSFLGKLRKPLLVQAFVFILKIIMDGKTAELGGFLPNKHKNGYNGA